MLNITIWFRKRICGSWPPLVPGLWNLSTIMNEGKVKKLLRHETLITEHTTHTHKLMLNILPFENLCRGNSYGAIVEEDRGTSKSGRFSKVHLSMSLALSLSLEHYLSHSPSLSPSPLPPSLHVFLSLHLSVCLLVEMWASFARADCWNIFKFMATAACVIALVVGIAAWVHAKDGGGTGAPHTSICVVILLHMRPHATYLSLYYYISVRILLHLSSYYCIHAVSSAPPLSALPYYYICPHPTTSVLTLLHTRSVHSLS
jgi:hypothetical protein